MACQINISIDVDTLRHYANFAPGGVVTSDPILSDTVPRLVDLLAQLEIRATFFVISETVLNQDALWLRVVREGHELASHSKTHFQAFHKLSLKRKKEELGDSKHAIEDCVGQAVVGFRAPAYNIDSDTLDLLVETGYAYDSSFCPGWYLPLSKVIFRLANRSYRSFSTSPLYWRSLWLPSKEFYWTTSNGRLLEVPIPTTSLGKPYIGTIHLNVSKWFFDSETNWLAKRVQLIPYAVHPIEVADQKVLEQAPWARDIPGVGKKTNPWDFLRYRLERLKRLGKVILLREVQPDGKRIVHIRA